MVKFFSFLFCCCSVFSGSLGEQFKKEILLWPRYSNNPLYKNIQKQNKFSEKSKIPKIIHQIWLGSPVPERYYAAMQSWKTHHPEWTYMLWTDKDIEPFKMQNKDLFDLAPNYGMKSDLLRMEILNRYGGLYVDVDQYCIKPHDIFHHVCSFYVCSFNGTGKNRVLVNNNVIGSSKNNPILECWLQFLPKRFPNKLKKDLEIIHGKTLFITGPFYLTSIIRRKRYKNCLILHNSFFNPLKTQKRKNIDLESVKSSLKPYSYSAHFHTCSW